MVLPTLSPTRGLPGTVAVCGVSPTSVAVPVQHQPASILVAQQGGSRELQIVRSRTAPQPRLALVHSLPAGRVGGGGVIVTTASASGGTIHHLGQSLPRGGGVVVPSGTAAHNLQANPLQQQHHQSNVNSIMSGNVQQSQQIGHLTSTSPAASGMGGQQQVKGDSTPSASQREAAGRSASRPTTPTHGLMTPLTVKTRTSPIQSPEQPRKRIKLEEKPAASGEIANYRKLICDEKRREMAKIKVSYKEQLTELFYLQNGGNIMDYFVWKKRPTVHLIDFLRSGKLDSEDEDDNEEKSINDEV